MDKLELERIKEQAYYNGMSMRPDFKGHAIRIALQVIDDFFDLYTVLNKEVVTVATFKLMLTKEVQED